MFRYNRLLNEIDSFYKKAFFISLSAKELTNPTEIYNEIKTIIDEDKLSDDPKLDLKTHNNFLMAASLFKWAVEDKIDINEAYSAISILLDDDDVLENVENFDAERDDDESKLDDLSKFMLLALDTINKSKGVKTVNLEHIDESYAKSLVEDMVNEEIKAGEDGVVIPGLETDVKYQTADDLSEDQKFNDIMQGANKETGETGPMHLIAAYVPNDPIQKYRNAKSILEIQKQQTDSPKIKNYLDKQIQIYDKLISLIPERNKEYAAIFHNTTEAAREKANQIQESIGAIQEALDMIDPNKAKKFNEEGLTNIQLSKTRKIVEKKDKEKIVNLKKQLKDLKEQKKNIKNIILSNAPELYVNKYNQIENEINKLTQESYNITRNTRTFRKENEINNKEKQLLTERDPLQQKIIKLEIDKLNVEKLNATNKKPVVELQAKLLERLKSKNPPTEEEYSTRFAAIEEAKKNIKLKQEINKEIAQEIKSKKESGEIEGLIIKLKQNISNVKMGIKKEITKDLEKQKHIYFQPLLDKIAQAKSSGNTVLLEKLIKELQKALNDKAEESPILIEYKENTKDYAPYITLLKRAHEANVFNILNESNIEIINQLINNATQIIKATFSYNKTNSLNNTLKLIIEKLMSIKNQVN